MMTNEYLKNNEIKTDELGRVIIEDFSLLEKINGAIASGSEFVLSDVACGNSNCVC